VIAAVTVNVPDGALGDRRDVSDLQRGIDLRVRPDQSPIDGKRKLRASILNASNRGPASSRAMAPERRRAAMQQRTKGGHAQIQVLRLSVQRERQPLAGKLADPVAASVTSPASGRPARP
jgi:hypothetical protein